MHDFKLYRRVLPCMFHMFLCLERHLIQMTAVQQKPFNQPSIEIRCSELGKHLIHAKQFTLSLGLEKTTLKNKVIFRKNPVAFLPRFEYPCKFIPRSDYAILGKITN